MTLTRVSAAAAIYDPDASEIKLWESSEFPGVLYLNLDRAHWFVLGEAVSDLAAEADAMERLSEVAGQAAERLRARLEAGEHGRAEREEVLKEIGQ